MNNSHFLEVLHILPLVYNDMLQVHSTGDTVIGQSLRGNKIERAHR